MKNKRNTTIDVLKGICSILVILSHYKWQNIEKLQLGFPFWVDMAVPIFLIISGYVNYNALENKKLKLLECYNSKRIFLKIIHFIIPYSFVFVFYVIKNMVQIIDFKWCLKEYIIGTSRAPGGYYITILIQFIFIQPIIYFIVKKYDYKGVLLIAALNLGYEIVQSYCNFDIFYYRLLIFRYLFIIAWGHYLASKEYKAKKIVNLISCISGLTFIMLTSYCGYEPFIFDKWTSTSMISCLYIVPIISYIIKKINFSNVLLEYLGKASYHIFLIQMVFFCDYVYYIYECICLTSVQMIGILIICLLGGCIFYTLEKKITSIIMHKKVKYGE